MRAAKSAGIQLLVINAKHHGGFCLWPSKFNDTYTVKNSPWRNGKGDMLREFVAACREEGVGVGFYLSPWDRSRGDYGQSGYVTYYHNQLRELLTSYGEVLEVWFDGANGGDGWYGGAKETRHIGADYYQWDTIYKMVHETQPKAVMYGTNELRWVGNENGVAGDPCWATMNSPKSADYGAGNQGDRNGKYWCPAESDFPQRNGWFWHPGGHSKSAAAMLDRYFTSVGRNTVMDIGIAPDRRGLICEEDAAELKGLGERIRAVFTKNLADGAKVTASEVRGNSAAYAGEHVLDGRSTGTCWAANDGTTDASVVLDFEKRTEFSVVSLREPIQLGQRIDHWALDSWQPGSNGGDWEQFAEGDGIGARRLWRGNPIVSNRMRLRIIGASASPALSEIAVYLEPESSRKEAGAALGKSYEAGLSKKGWKIVSASSEGAPAANAIDDNPATLWHSHTPAGPQPAPQQIVVDMGAQHVLSGMLYLPRQDNCTIGNVDRYAFYVSDDGTTWGEPAARGEFGNIKADPVQQRVVFDKPVKGRYFKFVALHSADGIPIAVAEIGVIGK